MFIGFSQFIAVPLYLTLQHVDTGSFFFCFINLSLQLFYTTVYLVNLDEREGELGGEGGGEGGAEEGEEFGEDE